MRKLLDRLQGRGHGVVLVRGALGAFIVKITGIGVLFGLHVLLARLLGVDQYGIYVYVITWINILTIPCLLGFNTSLVRFIAEYKAKQQWGLLKGIIRRSTQTVLGFSVLTSIVGVAVIWFLRQRLSDEQAIIFYIGFGLLPIFALCQLRGAALRALRCIVQSELLLIVIRPVLLGLIVLAFFFTLEGKLKVTNVMTSNIAAVAGVFITGTILLSRVLPEFVSQAEPVYAQRQWLKVSLPLMLTTTMHLVLNRTDVVMLGIILGTKQVGLYAAASNIAGITIFGLVATSGIAAPIISELYHTGKNKKLQSILTLAARNICFHNSSKHCINYTGKVCVGVFWPRICYRICSTYYSSGWPGGQCLIRFSGTGNGYDRPSEPSGNYSYVKRCDQYCIECRANTCVWPIRSSYIYYFYDGVVEYYYDYLRPL